MSPDEVRTNRESFDQPPHHTQEADPPLRSLLVDLIDGVSDLVRQELRLAQAETSEKVTRLFGGMVAMVVGLLVGTCAFLLLLQALVLVLSDHMAPATAALLVGGVVALIAVVAIYRGKSTLSAESLTPRRTLRSLREDTEMVMEKTR